MARRRRSTWRLRGNRRHGRRRGRLRRNIFFGADVMRDVLVPVLGGTAGFVAARALGNFLATKNLPVIKDDPRLGKTVAALAGLPILVFAGRKVPMVSRHMGALMLGMGMAPAEAWIRGTRFVGGAPPMAVTPPAEPPATSGMGQYYTEGMLGLGRGYDVSHYGAPYQGMLGLGNDDDWADQGTVDNAMDGMETGKATGISIVDPTDVAHRAPVRPQVMPVPPERMSQGGYAGGLFARHLFSGMMGS